MSKKKDIVNISKTQRLPIRKLLIKEYKKSSTPETINLSLTKVNNPTRLISRQSQNRQKRGLSQQKQQSRGEQKFRNLRIFQKNKMNSTKFNELNLNKKFKTQQIHKKRFQSTPVNRLVTRFDFEGSQQIKSRQPIKQEINNVVINKNFNQIKTNIFKKKTLNYILNRKNTNPNETNSSQNNLKQKQLKQPMKSKKKRDMHQYLNFICASPNQVYEVNECFDSIRNLSKKQYFDKFDIRTAYIIQNIFYELYENLNNKKYESTKEYCIYYFSLKQKIQLEISITANFLREFHTKIRLLYIFQRIVLYFIVVFLQHRQIFYVEILQPLKKIVYDIYISFAMVIRIALETISTNQQQQTKINDTFKILKSICQVEKNCDRIQEELRNLQEKKNHKELVEIQKASMNVFTKFSQNVQFQQKLYLVQRSFNWKILKIPPTPFLPPRLDRKIYTLALDLDQTLIYYNQQKEILKLRPHLMNFFQALSPLFQIVIFTASTKQYADKIINQFDPEGKYIKFRLYREHLRVDSSRQIKDITKLGRQICKTIIIDNISQNFRNCLQNGIIINTWEGDKTDNSLMFLIPILKSVVQNKIEDVRQFLKYQNINLLKTIQEKQQAK